MQTTFIRTLKEVFSMPKAHQYEQSRFDVDLVCMSNC